VARRRSPGSFRRRSKYCGLTVWNMITCVIQYTLDPHQIDDFEKYATTWPPIIERCGGRLTGYYLPKEGANDYALALIDFGSLAEDPDARANRQHAIATRCILAERRSFLRKV